MNLSLDTSHFMVLWEGVRGLKSVYLNFHLTRLLQSWPSSSVFIIHLEGNDVGYTKTLDLMHMTKKDLYSFETASPLSTITACQAWLVLSDLHKLDKIRRKINSCIQKCMPLIDVFSFCHVNLEGDILDLYRRDLVHLSEMATTYLICTLRRQQAWGRLEVWHVGTCFLVNMLFT